MFALLTLTILALAEGSYEELPIEMYGEVDWDLVYSDGVIASSNLVIPYHFAPIPNATLYEIDGKYVAFLGDVMTSSYPSKKTEKRLKAINKYIKYVKDKNVKSLAAFEKWNIDTLLLWNSLKSVFWVKAVYAARRSDPFWFIGSGFSVKPGTLISARHILADYQCWSIDDERPYLWQNERDVVCPSGFMKARPKPKSSVISDSVNSYRSWEMFLASDLTKEELEEDGVTHFVITDIVTSNVSDLSVISADVTQEFATLNMADLDTECKPGDDILFIGHPVEIEALWTKDGVFIGSTNVRQLYKGYLTVSKGKIKATGCTEKGRYRMYFDGIIWKGFGGGPVVLASDPNKVCALNSITRFQVQHHVQDHEGICINHPDIQDQCTK